ncbi:MAG: DUF393 domain-containing protein [Tardiphaga sp.]|nr:DUF393 domain-containing protein [Tardiphaga sp.]
MTQNIQVTGDADPASLTVYFDGSCPLCAAEIAYYRGQDPSKVICFRDVSQAGASTGPDLTRPQAMKRLHVRNHDGALVSGAAAFVRIWEELPGWRWAARIAKRRRVLGVLEMGYSAFLHVRPLISGGMRWLRKRR